MKLFRTPPLCLIAAALLIATDMGGQAAQPPVEQLVITSWSDLKAKGDAAFDRGDYTKANELLQSAVDVAEREFGKSDRRLEGLLESLGQAQRELAHSSDADATYHRLLALRQSIYGKRSVEAALAWNEIGQTWYEVSNVKRAKAPLELATAILDALPDAKEGDKALVLHNLAATHYLANENAIAEQMWRSVLKTRERLYGEQSSPVATTLYNLAMAADDDRHYEESAELFKRALKAYETSEGSDHPDVALCLVALAQNACYAGKPCASTAIPQLERALAIQRRAYGEKHPNLVDALLELARLQEKAKRPNLALPLREQLLAIAEAKNGVGSVATFGEHAALATDYAAVGDKANAKLHHDLARKLESSADDMIGQDN